LFWALGQSILSYYQLLLQVRTPFPSWADPAFTTGCALAVAALFAFCHLAFRSGMPLGGWLAFWGPAYVVGVALLALAFPLLGPIFAQGGTTTELFLNTYYPLVSLVSLAPCLVMLRVGLLFRGGHLLWVWLTLTLGFALVLCSDVMFSYFTTVGVKSVAPVMDLLYYAGYALIGRAVYLQLAVMRVD
jgi:hypothetical protein